MFGFIKNIFRRKKDMTENLELRELEMIIENHKNSDKLKSMVTSLNYYKGNHDILYRKRYGIGQNGERVELTNVPNYKIVDNHFKIILNQKINYVLSKEMTLSTENKQYANLLTETFNKELLNTLFLVGKDSYLYGVGWLYVYYNENGELSFKKIDSKELIPVWKNETHSELNYAIRLYNTSKFNGKGYDIIENVEVYTLEGVQYFTLKNGRLVSNGELKSYITIGNKEYQWSRLPLITFKSNEMEMPLILKGKNLQDSINEILSDFKNDMSENNRNTILVIKNYGGQGGEFRQNLNTYGYIAVNDGGGVETLNIEVNATNYESILRMLEKSIYKNLAGVDLKDDRFGNNPNRMNIQTMYFDIDLDSNAFEREFQDSMNKLLWFVNQHFMLTKKGDYTKERVSIILNRDIMINETQAIEDCQKSVGLLSTESILSQHPWVKDVQLELKRKVKENDIYNLENVSELVNE